MQFAVLMDNFRGAREMLFHLAARWRRTDRTTWGATSDEVGATFPGDELVPNCSWGYTHAITIDAAPLLVWQWVVQLGQGRGGFYSFELLENIVGCDVHNTTVPLPEFQALAVGDAVRLHPKSPPLTVAIAEPGRCLALVANAPDATGDAVSLWAFHLIETPDGNTRLIERGRYLAGPSVGARLMLGPAILEPISFVMSRQMLRTIKALADHQVVEERATPALVAVKTIHTMAWLTIESSMVYVLVAGLAGRTDRRVAIAAAIVTGETLVFAANGFRCPLTAVAESLGADNGSVTDIYLPPWFARNLPGIHVPLIIAAVYLHARNLGSCAPRRPASRS